MSLSTSTAELVVGLGPSGFLQGMAGELMECLPEKFGAGVASMNDHGTATAFGHRCNATEVLHRGRVCQSLTIGAKGCQQPWGHGFTGSRKAAENRGVGMLSHQPRQLRIKLGQRMIELSQLPCEQRHGQCMTGLKSESVVSGRAARMCSNRSFKPASFR